MQKDRILNKVMELFENPSEENDGFDYLLTTKVESHSETDRLVIESDPRELAKDMRQRPDFKDFFTSIVDYLMSYDCSILLYAINNQDFQLFEMMLPYYDANVCPYIHEIMSIACDKGYSKIVALVMNKYAHLLENEYLYDYMAIVLSKNYIDIVKILRNHEVSWDLDCYDTCPITIACYCESTDLLEYLLDDGATYDTDINEYHPFIASLECGNWDCAQILIDRGFDMESNILTVLNYISIRLVEYTKIKNEAENKRNTISNPVEMRNTIYRYEMREPKYLRPDILKKLLDYNNGDCDHACYDIIYQYINDRRFKFTKSSNKN